TEYQSVSFKSVTKSGSDIEETSEKSEESAEDKKTNAAESLDKLCEYIKQVLGEKVLEVKKTSRLAESPVCLSIPEGGMEIRFERFMIENKQLNEARPKIFEINQNHKIIKKLSDEIMAENFDKNEISKKKIDETIKLLFAQANIIEGEPVPDIKEYANNINKLIELSLVA
ncbi:MAG TPA: molecular chaperone HtpG, partial [Alphaproteobacteria bacterium]|nr:molecular chaperone HtpG [Alphaproteobacteria bacterium]